MSPHSSIRTLRPTGLPAFAGFGYVVAWVAGLSIFPVNLALDANRAEVVDAYTKHRTVGALQYVLVEGVAAVLLALVFATLFAMWSTQHSSAPRPAYLFVGIAVTISLAQCALGLAMIQAAQRTDSTVAFDLYGAVNRLDGVKMLALAALAVSLVVRGKGGLPRWLRTCGVLLAGALLISAIAYLFLWNALAWSVYVSGPLLLLWVAGIGASVSRAHRRSKAV